MGECFLGKEKLRNGYLLLVKAAHSQRHAGVWTEGFFRGRIRVAENAEGGPGHLRLQRGRGTPEDGVHELVTLEYVRRQSITSNVVFTTFQSQQKTKN